jgi:curli biogenesis system outer membrane secretion channel CsgG
MFTSLVVSVTGCVSANHPTLKFPALNKPTPHEYTGPRFRVVLAPFKVPEEAKELLVSLGYKNIGSSLTEQATNHLVNAGYLQVLERSMLGKVVNNLDLEADRELFDQTTTQKKGNFLGAEYVLVGSIEEVEPNLSKAEMKVEIPMMAELKGSVDHASVRLSVRLVHSGTGEVLAAGTGKGILKTSGVGFEVNYLGLAKNKSASFSMSQSAKTPLGYAFNSALNYALSGLSKRLISAPWSCRVASANGSRVAIECGSKHRVRKGMLFQYYSRNGVIQNEGGQVIGYDEEQNGTAVVKSVQKKASIAIHTGEVPPKVGDAVVLIQAGQE